MVETNKLKDSLTLYGLVLQAIHVRKVQRAMPALSSHFRMILHFWVRNHAFRWRVRVTGLGGPPCRAARPECAALRRAFRRGGWSGSSLYFR
jgi:hypothetical protein